MRPELDIEDKRMILQPLYYQNTASSSVPLTYKNLINFHWYSIIISTS